MKAKQEGKEEYKPVTITLETKEEFMALYDLANLSDFNVQEVADITISNTTEEEFKDFFNKAFEVLHTIKDKLDDIKEDD